MTRLVLALLLLPGAAAAQILSNPGFCDATGPEQELAGLARLTPDGIEAHSAACTWAAPGQSYDPGRTATLAATCDDGARQWAVGFDLSVDARGRVTLRADGVNPLPDVYFPCASWGYRGE